MPKAENAIPDKRQAMTGSTGNEKAREDSIEVGLGPYGPSNLTTKEGDDPKRPWGLNLHSLRGV
jgi:hypothetical protein